MAGTNVKITITDNDTPAVTVALQKLARRSGDLKLVFQDIGEYLKLSHSQRFRDQKSPEGDPWEALSESYRARKKKNKDRILVLDDYLGKHLRYQPTSKGLAFGTDSKYGATHQFGREEANIPARPYLGLSEEDQQEVVRLVNSHLSAAL